MNNSDKSLFAELYLRREAEANAASYGADCKAILADLCEEAGITFEEGRAIVLNHTITLGVG